MKTLGAYVLSYRKKLRKTWWGEGGGGWHPPLPTHLYVRGLRWRNPLLLMVWELAVPDQSWKTDLLRLQLHTTPSDGSLLWFPQIYTNYMFSKMEVRLNTCIIKSPQRDVLGKTGGDFPEEMSHQIGIVIKSWVSRMISLNQLKVSHFYFTILIKFVSKVYQQSLSSAKKLKAG